MADHSDDSRSWHIYDSDSLAGSSQLPDLPRRQTRRGLHRAQRLMGFATVLGVWSFFSYGFGLPKFVLPGPDLVARAAYEQIVSGVAVRDAMASSGRIATAFVGAIAIAFPVGFAMGTSKVVRRALEPVLLVYQAIPGIAWIPLAIVWFGLGDVAVAFVIFTSMMGIISYGVFRGLISLPHSYRDAVMSLGGSRWHLLRHVYLPGTMPAIVTSVRLGLAYGWRALVAAELIAAVSGLGFRIFQAQQFLRVDRVIAGMLMIGFLWLALDRAVLVPLERRTVERWGGITKS